MRSGSERDQPVSARIVKIIAALAFASSAIGILLVCEVIRPFHDLTVDGPLAVILWVAGTALGGYGLFMARRSRALIAVGLMANVVPLLAALVLWWVLSRTNFAWH
jgi:hypothetical protein